jgi:phosphomannomutase
MHFYFASFANCEASEYAMLLLIQLLQRTGQPLSELWQPLVRYAHSGEKNYRLTEASYQVIARIQEQYAAQATKETLIDGLRYEFRNPDRPDQDWWFSVRASNTEPVLRLNVEARERARLEEKRSELEYAIIGTNGSAPSTHSSDLPSS